MNDSPKIWRQAAGMTLRVVAEAAGIAGKNPSRTLERYETGEGICPADVVESIRKQSGGKVTAESWNAVRLAFLKRQKPQSRAGRRRRSASSR